MRCESNTSLTNRFFGAYNGCQNALSCLMKVVFSDQDLCTWIGKQQQFIWFKTLKVGLCTILKGPLSAMPLLLFTCEGLAIIFSSEHIKTKEIAVKILKIIKHTDRNTIYSKEIRFCFTMQYQQFRWRRKWRRLTRVHVHYTFSKS